MAIPAINAPCWSRLASGKATRFKTEHLGTQLLLKRLERSTDPEAVKVREVHAFFEKWQHVLAKEIIQLNFV